MELRMSRKERDRLKVMAAVAGAPPEPAAPEPPKAAKEPEQVLLEKAGAGTLTDEVLALFKQYADARARERFVPATVPEDFWTWVAFESHKHLALAFAVVHGRRSGHRRNLDRLARAASAEASPRTRSASDAGSGSAIICKPLIGPWPIPVTGVAVSVKPLPVRPANRT